MTLRGVRGFAGLVSIALVAFGLGYLASAAFSGVLVRPREAFSRTAAWSTHFLRRENSAYREAGRRTYERQCATCHGVPAADAARLAHRAFAPGRSDWEVFRVIERLPAHGPMRQFAGPITDQGRLSTIAYLREMAERPEVPPPRADALPDGRYEYVAHLGGVTVYDIDGGFEPVRFISFPPLQHQHGIAANIANGLLYVSYRREGSGFPEQLEDVGQMTAFDMERSQPLWTREIRPGIDSFAVTTDGRKIYMPAGEDVAGRTRWIVLDGRNGDELSRIDAVPGPHNTILSPDERFVYLGATGHDHLIVVDVSSDRVVGKIGPFGERIRPFALSSDGRFALVTVNFFSGFEVADLSTRQVLYRVAVEGWPWVDPPLPAVQSHGVAFSPDEREVWVNDEWNRRVHIFDSSRLPEKPVYLDSVDVDPPHDSSDRDRMLLPKWVRFTRDGRWVHVSNGAIIDAATREVVHWIMASRHWVEVHWRDGKPVKAFPRYGNGYRTQVDSLRP